MVSNCSICRHGSGTRGRRTHSKHEFTMRRFMSMAGSCSLVVTMAHLVYPESRPTRRARTSGRLKEICGRHEMHMVSSMSATNMSLLAVTETKMVNKAAKSAATSAINSSALIKTQPNHMVSTKHIQTFRLLQFQGSHTCSLYRLTSATIDLFTK